MYGSRHIRDFGESVPDVWRQQIAKLKAHEIERGLRRLTIAGSGSPPTLPQFVKACKEVKEFGADDTVNYPPGTLIEEKDLRDKWDRFADHLFLNYLRRKNGVKESLLPLLIQIKKDVAAQYRSIGEEDHVEPQEMVSHMTKMLDAAK